MTGYWTFGISVLVAFIAVGLACETQLTIWKNDQARGKVFRWSLIVASLAMVLAIVLFYMLDFPILKGFSWLPL